MILILLAFALVLAIAAYQVIQGVYSALIMSLLTTVSALVAFGFYEKLGELFLYKTHAPYADGISLMALFFVTLLVTRLLADRFLGKNVVLGLWPDRIGGGALGLYTGLICTGILAIAFQMMPFTEQLLGYQTHTDSLQRKDRLAPFYPDEFTVGMVSKLSNLALGGDRGYTENHDDLLRELFCGRNTAGKFGRVDCEWGKDETPWLTVIQTFEPNDAHWKAISGHEDRPAYPLLSPGTQRRRIIVHASVTNKARDKAENDQWFRLPGTHFRLVTARGASYYPIGFLEPPATPDKKFKAIWAPESQEEEDIEEGAGVALAKLVYVKKANGSAPLDVYLVYELGLGDQSLLDVDSKASKDEPSYLVFRRVARSSLNKPLEALPRVPKPKAPPVKKPKMPAGNN